MLYRSISAHVRVTIWRGMEERWKLLFRMCKYQKPEYTSFKKRLAFEPSQIIRLPALGFRL